MAGEEARVKRIRLEEESCRQELPLGREDRGEEDIHPDLISRLPSDILIDVITLLPTRDGARTQAISRRWRHLWRAAPLDLQVDRSLSGREYKRMSMVPKILAGHPGPVRRLALPGILLRNRYAKIDGWLRSEVLTGLQEFKFSYAFEYPKVSYPLPPSALRFAPTLCVAEFGCCNFPNEIAPSLNFPCLKKLTLNKTSISEGALHSLLSSCPVLESLWLLGNAGVGRLHINSATLMSISFRALPSWNRVKGPILLQELVIGDAPCLQRLILFDTYHGPATIRVMQAPALKIMGMLSADISELVLGTTIFREMVALSLTTLMPTVKVLSLVSLGPNLEKVVNFLKCFPCVEKLYITCLEQKNMKNAQSYDPLNPIECLELHLKKIVINSYRGLRPDVDFAKFFVLNAKVLRKMIFGVNNSCNVKWLTSQRRRLQLDNKASQDAQFAFGRDYRMCITSSLKTDPFESMEPVRFPEVYQGAN